MCACMVQLLLQYVCFVCIRCVHQMCALCASGYVICSLAFFPSYGGNLMAGIGHRPVTTTLSHSWTIATRALSLDLLPEILSKRRRSSRRSHKLNLLQHTKTCWFFFTNVFRCFGVDNGYLVAPTVTADGNASCHDVFSLCTNERDICKLQMTPPHLLLLSFALIAEFAFCGDANKLSGL